MSISQYIEYNSPSVEDLKTGNFYQLAEILGCLIAAGYASGDESERAFLLKYMDMLNPEDRSTFAAANLVVFNSDYSPLINSNILPLYHPKVEELSLMYMPGNIGNPWNLLMEKMYIGMSPLFDLEVLMFQSDYRDDYFKEFEIPDLNMIKAMAEPLELAKLKYIMSPLEAVYLAAKGIDYSIRELEWKMFLDNVWTELSENIFNRTLDDSKLENNQIGVITIYNEVADPQKEETFIKILNECLEKPRGNFVEQLKLIVALDHNSRDKELPLFSKKLNFENIVEKLVSQREENNQLFLNIDINRQIMLNNIAYLGNSQIKKRVFGSDIRCHKLLNEDDIINKITTIYVKIREDIPSANIGLNIIVNKKNINIDVPLYLKSLMTKLLNYVLITGLMDKRDFLNSSLESMIDEYIMRDSCKESIDKFAQVKKF